MIKRKLLEQITDHLKKPEISLIIGPRQAGKTTLMRILEQNLRQKGINTIFLSLDFEKDKPFFTSQELLLKKISLEVGQRGVVFIDEIQRKENAGIFLKGLFDLLQYSTGVGDEQNLPYKLIVSGSGSLELKEKIHESLVGRKRIFELSTVTFEEFIHYQTNYRYTNNFKEFLEIEQNQITLYLQEYLCYGGYPRIITERNTLEKHIVMDEIYNSYLNKDIKSLLNVEKIDAFTTLIRLLATQIGNLINYQELATATGLSQQTIKNYLWYAEKTFIIKKLPPFFRNQRKEIVKAPKIYFLDIGLRNYACGLFGNYLLTSNDGSIFENFIFNILTEAIRYTGASLHFWRTKDKAEVDFIINFGDMVIPIEVKSELKIPKIQRSMRSFIDKYKPEKAIIINKTLKDSIQVHNTKIYFIPYTDLLVNQTTLINHIC